MADEFFPNREGLNWESGRTGADCTVYLGDGSGSRLEIVMTKSDSKPTKEFLQTTYTDRRDGRVSPVLVVVQYGSDKVGLCGPSGEEPMVFRDIDVGQAQRVCEAALDKPSGSSARSFLKDTIPQLSDDLAGLHNQGLLSTHELIEGVPQRDDWAEAAERAQNALTEDPRELLEGLNYIIERDTDHSYVLKHTEDGRESAVAVFLEEEESFEHKQDRFVGDSPVAYALRQAEQRNLDYVIGNSGDQLRLYTTNPEAGFGSRGQTDTYVEVNTRLLDDEQAAYLWLLFSGDALQEGGSLHEIMEDSKEYATGLGERLRERIYDDVVPQLAEALAEARNLDDPDKDDLDETYRMTLVLLYRLLFVAYAEDERFLPRYRNNQYDKYSIKQKARDIDDGMEFDEHLTTLWDEVMTLTTAIHEGSSTMGLPAYDGRLLSDDEEWTEAGHQLSQVELSDAEFGPALEALLIDETPDGWEGPVDFRNVGVREFGVIYEGLLESELSLADQDLAVKIDDGDEQYVPAEEDDEVVIEEGEVYLHGQSGERKATGTYYTKTRFVEHLLDYSLEPALEDHLDRVDRIREEEGDAAAADAFFDFRTADIAMGSGHFLVGAVDRIEKAFRNYLQETTLTGVEEELDNLKDAAEAAFADEEYTPDIERSQLLRRQIARRCIYGVDLNELATELARLSLWVHTFVPGLPLTFLDYNLQSGDALVGVGTLGEVSDELGMEEDQVTLGNFDNGTGIIDELDDEIQNAKNVSDTSAEKVQEARETRDRIDDSLAPVRARLDILTAARIDEGINTNVATDSNIEDPTGLSTYEDAQDALKPFDVFHFPTAFPEVFEGSRAGFDAVVGNPPWDKVIFEAQQFWVTRHPGLNALPKTRRDEKIEELREKHPHQADEEEREKSQREQYQDYVGDAFEDQGRGHYDYAKLFVERATDLLHDEGELGYVLPRQCLVLGGWKQLRRRLFNDSEATVLQARNSGQWIFENVESRYMIVLVTSVPAKTEAGAYVWPAIEEEKAMDDVSFETSIYLSRDDLANLTTADRMIVPWFNSEGARDVFPKMEKRPRLSDESGWFSGIHDSRWDFRGSGRHSDISNSERESHHWRVFMTRSVDQYGINEEKEFRRFVDPEDLLDVGNGVEKHNGDIRLSNRHPTVTFRHVSRNDDTRTMIATVLPESDFVYCAGYVHGVDHDADASREDLLALLGYFNSFTCGWWARRIVDRHVTAPVINNLPIPEWDSEEIQQVAELAGELTRRNGIETLPGGQTVPTSDSAESLDNDEIRARIESLVAKGYDLEREELDTVLSDFSMKAASQGLRERIQELAADNSAESVATDQNDD
jgi:hypothetical protein